MKTSLALMLWLTALLAGCAVPPGNRADRATQPVAQILVHIGAGRRIETAPSAHGSCNTQQIVYVDESKGVRQVIVDWSALSERFSYTLSSEGRADLIARIQDRGKGCTLIQSQQTYFIHLGTNQRSEVYSFVRYWLEGNAIHLQAVQLAAKPDTSGAMQFRPEPFNFSVWSDLRTENWGNKPYRGPVAKPQVAYRIDEHRFFEVVPYEELSCARARLYYNDTAKGIRANIAPWDQVLYGAFIIDAANDQYLVTPVIGSSSGCQTGDGSSFKCASRLPYSVDAGKTWKFHIPKWMGSGDVYMAGSQIYHAGARSSVELLTKGYNASAWIDGLLTKFPKPTKPPIDTKLHCD